ncbi:MAG: hypothetical protein HY326_06415 [Chloroflexi bacterium]|nr:hypothetical protein [Chloroflexota bacterium]
MPNSPKAERTDNESPAITRPIAGIEEALLNLDSQQSRSQGKIEGLEQLVLQQMEMIEKLGHRLTAAESANEKLQSQIDRLSALEHGLALVRTEFGIRITSLAEEQQEKDTQTLNRLETLSEQFINFQARVQEMAADLLSDQGKMVPIPYRLAELDMRADALGRQGEDLVAEVQRLKGMVERLPDELKLLSAGLAVQQRNQQGIVDRQERMASEVMETRSIQGQVQNSLGVRIQEIQVHTAELLNLQEQIKRIPGRLEELDTRLVGVVRQTEDIVVDVQHLKSVTDRFPDTVKPLAAGLALQQRNQQVTFEQTERLATEILELQGAQQQIQNSLGMRTKEIQANTSELLSLQEQVKRLPARIDDHTEQISVLGHTLEALDGRLEQFTVELSRWKMLEDALARTRDELSMLIREADYKRETFAASVLKTRQEDREAIGRSITQIIEDIKVLTPIQQRLDELAVEDRRVNDQILIIGERQEKLEHEIVARTERLPLLDERIGKITDRVEQIELKLPKFNEEDDALLARLVLIEDWLPRYAEQLGELRRFEMQLQRQQVEWMESIRISEENRSREVKGWLVQIEAFAQQMAAWAKDQARFAETYDQAKKLIVQIQELADTTRKEQKQMAELQRLAEERLQREWAHWQVEHDKQWELFQRERNWQWSEQKKANEKHASRLGTLETWRGEHTERTNSLEQTLRQLDIALQRGLLEMMRFQRARAAEQLEQAQQWLLKTEEQVKQAEGNSRGSAHARGDGMAASRNLRRRI